MVCSVIAQRLLWCENPVVLSAWEKCTRERESACTIVYVPFRKSYYSIYHKIASSVDVENEIQLGAFKISTLIEARTTYSSPRYYFFLSL